MWVEGRAGPFPFQVPWEARGPLVLEVEGEGGKRAYLLSVDPTKPLLSLRFQPPRAAWGEEVEVSLEALFPAEEAFLLLPGGRALPLAKEGGAFRGRFRLEEAWAGQAVDLGPVLGLPLPAFARQGERRVEAQARLLVAR
ncbi:MULTISPECIES: hypothetical protein [unclassified Meiothermus]|uniref:hypothetical protein n=1 Tax=unclassified Meiothermus TaxID=370471 RepID=UPI000D7BAD37|nr:MULTISPECIES: hypothetical protein [unclassified Meiothermus]PZA05956.1 hypothetical protein DNA98_15830 [Meiothermus sp. Pnk-1]RYM36441.1 hypothetical protein EWH23_09465 [Meiothermus sp. PNK-Is4]